MRLFYNSEGKIIATVDGFSTDPRLDGFGVEGCEMINIHLGHPLEQLARDLENPGKPITIEDIKFDKKEKNLRELTKEEKKERDDKKAKDRQDAEAWQRKNPPRDLQAEVDELKKELAALKANKEASSKPE